MKALQPTACFCNVDVNHSFASGDIVDFATEEADPGEAVPAPAQLSVPSEQHHAVHKSLSDASLMHQVGERVSLVIFILCFI